MAPAHTRTAVPISAADPQGGPLLEGSSQTRHTIAAIIPLYNGRRFIAEAIASVVNQTRPPDEIIVVDDGSTDGGADVVRELARTLPVTLLSKPNGGQSSARNFGIAHARSSLIALLDQDDFWYPRHLEVLEQPFLTHPDAERIGWVYSDLDELDETGGLTRQCLMADMGVVHPKTNVFDCLAQDMFILPSAALFRRSASEAVGGFDERLSGYEDDDFFLRLLRARYLNLYVPEALSAWRMHGTSASRSPRMTRSRLIFAQKLIEAFPRNAATGYDLGAKVVLPRFLAIAVERLRAATQDCDYAAIPEAREELETLLPYLHPRALRRFRRALKWLDWGIRLRNRKVMRHAAKRLTYAWERFSAKLPPLGTRAPATPARNGRTF
ncbi:glycosyltransferase family 2 protein [Azorhizobium doebereinerae]|uniref:glycosyltransferase family 2 protein n=1 Tax=Azorhizobium doebereinerae TaxID=281091 RepID=UPI00041C2E9A|nr:glycosyltransferase [Azorhizobium doebereinerae]